MLHRAIIAAAVVVFVHAPLFAQSPAPVRPDPRVQALVAEVSAERLGALVDRLASFETRHTLSSADQPTRGIGAARQWMLDELRGYSPHLQVSFDTHIVPPGGRITREVELRNVVAVLPGRSTRRIYVSGHYDTVVIGADPDDPAPGANDDGSGTALMMELARVLANSGIDFDATLVFIGFAGEEQGLVGARLHAAAAVRDGLQIDAVFNNDIIGNTRGGNGVDDGASVRVFSAGPEDSPSRQLARYVRRTAAAYVPAHAVRPIAREDRFGRGGDHTPFDREGFAAVRFTESKEDYSRQHTIRDTPDGVDPQYLARNARVNIAGVAALALAPPAPRVLDERGNPTLGRGNGYDAHLRWQPSPGAVGYRVFRREAWGPDWQHAVDVGNVTEYVFADLSIDDHNFGVAAIGPAGNESLVSAYVRPPRDWSQVQ
jgi:hypothetical protein